MAKKYTPTAGLRNVGSYQVSGTPFVTSSTITEGDEIRIPFPSVTNNIAVQLSLSPARAPFGFHVTSRDHGGAQDSTPMWQPTYNNQSFSISFWGKMDALALLAQCRPFGLAMWSTTATERFYVGFTGDNTFRILGRSAPRGGVGSQTKNVSFSMNTIVDRDGVVGGGDVLLDWTFWTWMCDPTRTKLYLNNTLFATWDWPATDGSFAAGSMPSTFQTTAAQGGDYFGIGDPYNTNYESVKFSYSDAVVWNNVLSPEQMDQMYISGSSGFDYDFPLTGAYWQGQELPAPWTSSSVGMLSYDWEIGYQAVGAGGYVSDPITPFGDPAALTNQNGDTMADGWNYIAGPRGLKFAAAITNAEYWSLRVPPGWISSTGGTLDPTPFTGETYNIYYYDDLAAQPDATGTDIKIQEGATAADNAARTIMAINGTDDDALVKFSSEYLRINGIPGFSGSLSPLYSSDAVDIMVEPDHEQDLVAKAPYVCVRISGTIGNQVGWYAQNQESLYTDADQWQKGWFDATPLVEPLAWYRFNTQSATLATGGGYFTDTDIDGATNGLIHNRSQSPAAIARGASAMVILSDPSAASQFPTRPDLGSTGKQEYTLGYGGVAGGAGTASMSLKPTGSYPNVLTNKHYWKLENKNDKLSMNIKTKEIYLSATGGDCLYSVQADLTTIPTGSMFELTGEGIDS